MGGEAISAMCAAATLGVAGRWIGILNRPMSWASSRGSRCAPCPRWPCPGDRSAGDARSRSDHRGVAPSAPRRRAWGACARACRDRVVDAIEADIGVLPDVTAAMPSHSIGCMGRGKSRARSLRKEVGDSATRGASGRAADVCDRRRIRARGGRVRPFRSGGQAADSSRRRKRSDVPRRANGVAGTGSVARPYPSRCRGKARRT